MGRNYKDFNGTKNPNYRTGFCVGKKPGFYNSWLNMKSRCFRKTNPKYPRYGGRGISVCEDWLNIKNFSKWALENGWEPGKVLDRINNDGNYEPTNCQWISSSENSRKKRTTKISFSQAILIRERLNNGENAYDLAKEYGVVHGTIWFIQNNFTHVPEGKCTLAIKERDRKNNQ